MSMRRIREAVHVQTVDSTSVELGYSSFVLKTVEAVGSASIIVTIISTGQALRKKFPDPKDQSTSQTKAVGTLYLFYNAYDIPKICSVLSNLQTDLMTTFKIVEIYEAAQTLRGLNGNDGLKECSGIHRVSDYDYDFDLKDSDYDPAPSLVMVMVTMKFKVGRLRGSARRAMILFSWTGAVRRRDSTPRSKDNVKVTVLAFIKPVFRPGETTIRSVAGFDERQNRTKVVQLSAHLKTHDPSHMPNTATATRQRPCFANTPSNLHVRCKFGHESFVDISVDKQRMLEGGLEWKLRLCPLVAVAKDTVDVGIEGMNSTV
ncbi:hypothetical protein BDP27DRAFT_1371717 [Rhodocollybia butyracea]|uniref:Uncharacterized protein n=1 Tax=Rhodocollybia butyracea TaxID=206335 RepID=A0A9P5P9B2_9AGAR|nr:hypothetical protein BDP27DRAFT_1371717 [Rhodocollybia butyracea]